MHIPVCVCVCVCVSPSPSPYFVSVKIEGMSRKQTTNHYNKIYSKTKRKKNVEDGEKARKKKKHLLI